MIKLSKFKIIFGIVTITTAFTLPFLILSINEKTVKNHKNISDTAFVKKLKSESLKVISALKQKNVKSFSSTSDSSKEQIKDFSKFEKDFQDFIDEVSQNLNLNLKKLAKEKLVKKGVPADKIEQIFATKSLKNSKIKNQNSIIKPQTFSSKSASSLKMEEFANKLWDQHVSSAAFAAINYGLAIAYGSAWMFGSAAASTVAGGILTYLSIEYKNTYNALVYDKNWSAIKKLNVTYWLEKGSRTLSYYSIGSSAEKIVKKLNSLRKIQTTAVVGLQAVKWATPQVKIILLAIDFFQSIISV
ncbi:hypothetical protein [Mycoplasma sp. 'Moose RK']|uniref:hypothetical protein n=1 Tax=Mycoplasma sp. 'Moose RK' TaxID=2780095 RepID=UPI0018C33B3C|nr:hypothetical protein [Mycoplasma sp. 'Moose RK']MBG0730791.1 hypothetical protein [Mycoplasma sp. 'Moose RK']